MQAQYNPFMVAPDSTKKWEYQENLSDEFTDIKIDWTNKWFYNSELPNVNAWKWDNNANLTIVNNAVEIKMSHNTNNVPVDGTYFSSGILKTKGTFITGYVEARIKGAILNVAGTDNGRGVCPSFWLYSDFDRNAAEGKTVYSEIDVVELQQFDYYNGEQDDIYDMDMNLHRVAKEGGKEVWYRPKQSPEAQKNHYTAKFNPTLDYHIYGCEVNESQIIWYVDGLEVARKPNTYWYRPMNVTVSLGLRVPFVKFQNNRFEPIDPRADERANKQLAAIPTTMSVDYVRVWKKKETLNLKESAAKKMGINVYPNPVKDTVTIAFNEYGGEAKISLADMNGSLLLDQKSAELNIILSLNKYSKGVYLLKVENEKGAYVQKLIVE